MQNSAETSGEIWSNGQILQQKWLGRLQLLMLRQKMFGEICAVCSTTKGDPFGSSISVRLAGSSWCDLTCCNRLLRDLNGPASQMLHLRASFSLWFKRFMWVSKSPDFLKPWPQNSQTWVWCFLEMWVVKAPFDLALRLQYGHFRLSPRMGTATVFFLHER